MRRIVPCFRFETCASCSAFMPGLQDSQGFGRFHAHIKRVRALATKLAKPFKFDLERLDWNLVKCYREVICYIIRNIARKAQRDVEIRSFDPARAIKPAL